MSRRIRQLALCSLVAALAAMLAAAPSSPGVSSGSTYVPVTVPASLTIASNCPGPANTFTTMLRGATQTTTMDCRITFGSDNADNVQLRATDSSDSWGLSSGTNQIPDVSGTNAQLTPSSFGLCLHSYSGGTPARTLSTTCQAIQFVWFGLQASSPTMIGTSATAATSTSADLRFGLATQNSTPPGAYTNTITFEVIAP